MNTFENAQIGDRVWSILCGWGTIVLIEDRSVHVVFKDPRNMQIFTFCGRHDIEDLNPTLFWGEMTIQSCGFSDIKMQEANTRLIKSAPAMYVLLQDLLSGRADVDHDITRDRIRHIIYLVEDRK
jgi:hypothetical protein